MKTRQVSSKGGNEPLAGGELVKQLLEQMGN